VARATAANLTAAAAAHMLPAAATRLILQQAMLLTELLGEQRTVEQHRAQ